MKNAFEAGSDGTMLSHATVESPGSGNRRYFGNLSVLYKSERRLFLAPHLRRPVSSPTDLYFRLPLVADLTMAIPFREALQRLENRRVKSTRPLIPPQILQEDLPLCVFLRNTASC